MLISAIRERTVFPQNPRNAQKLLVEKGLPQIAQIYTDVGGYGILPYPRSQQYPQTSVNSVNSVGELTQPTICVDQCNPWANCIPTERTEAYCREESPTDSIWSCNYYKLTQLLLVSLCRLKYNVYISSIKVPPPSNITYYRKPMSAW